MKIHRLSLMLCQLRFSDSLNKDYDENIHLPGLWLDTDGERCGAGGCHHPHRHHADDPRGADGKAFAPEDGRGRTLRIQSVTVHS